MLTRIRWLCKVCRCSTAFEPHLITSLLRSNNIAQQQLVLPEHPEIETDARAEAGQVGVLIDSVVSGARERGS